MSENNRSYRIRTNVGSKYNGDLNLNIDLLQDYDELEVLSLKISTDGLYKYHTSHYGCVVGRVLANGGVGVPNVKISAFIPVEDVDTLDPVYSFLYPYSSTRDKNRDNIRYNLLTDTKIDDCHRSVGTFPNKRLVLDDNNVIEIYDKYYKFTTTTNGSGDYMLFGLPVGNNIIHSDLDLSDIGILSQKPRDLFYKGYTAKQFENASQFKKDTNLDNLTQVISQDSSVYVFPFWGDEIENEGQIKIVRNDIDVNYKFEPTCIFIGCIVSDEKSNAISKNCIPHERMGKMDRLTTGAGTIEMIRKTISGGIESFSVQGNELIDGNGTWCYQIPMNLDYVATDEYGNLVPTDNYDKGIPTRTSVRFRVSLADYESDYENAHLVKVLVPNNPSVEVVDDTKYINYDYEFGSSTKDESFRDMFWNNVYSVKSYIPRFQKGNRQRNKNFTGFKSVNVNGANNPIPYNNMRINLTFLFVFQCLIFKSLVLIVKTLNKIIYVINELRCSGTMSNYGFGCNGEDGLVYLTLDGGMCPSLDGNYISPGAVDKNRWHIVEHTYHNVFGDDFYMKFNVEDSNISDPPEGKFHAKEGSAIAYDPKSADGKNSDLKDGVQSNKISSGYTVEDVEQGDENDETTDSMKVYNQESYFIKCVELQFAMEYEVIQFDFYNDWINGMIYIPRWFAEIRKNKDQAYYCGNTFGGNRYLTQQCAIAFDSGVTIPGGELEGSYKDGCRGNGKLQCHKRWGRKQARIFGSKNRGIVVAQKNSRGQYAYYLRPSELVYRDDMCYVKANLFQTDIIMLGSVLECNQYGIPKVNGYTSSSYKMPPPVAEIVSDTQEMILGNVAVDAKVMGIIAMADQLNDIISQNLNSNSYLNETIEINEKHLSGITTTSTQDKLKSAVKSYNGYTGDFNHLVGQKILYFTILNFYNSIADKKISMANFYVDPNEYTGRTINDNSVQNDITNIANDIINDCVGKFKNIYRIIQDKSIGYYPCSINHDGILCVLSKKIDDYRKALVSSSVTTKTKMEDAYNETYKIYQNITEEDKIAHFYQFDKRMVSQVQLSDADEITYAEFSGIDWGYNPFETGNEDNTTEFKKQIAGHFLEIGCTFSMSNIKSCVNLQRVCELGGEISQSHYYLDTNVNVWRLLDPTGIISKREVIDTGIRNTFATLNSSALGVIYDSMNGYKKYSFKAFSPVSFMGDLENRTSISDLKNETGILFKTYGLIENQSLSYKAFRFGTTNSVTDKFLISQNISGNIGYYMPQYENSLYFYFGLRDGNTAIDRLYTEYYAQCDADYKKPYVGVNISKVKIGELSRYSLTYSTENMNSIKSISVKFNNIIQKIGTDIEWDKKKNTIILKHAGAYIITFRDIMNEKVKIKVTIDESKILDIATGVTNQTIDDNSGGNHSGGSSGSEYNVTILSVTKGSGSLWNIEYNANFDVYEIANGSLVQSGSGQHGTFTLSGSSGSSKTVVFKNQSGDISIPKNIKLLSINIGGPSVEL